MINVSNSTSKNNPLRLIGTPAGPTRPSGRAGLAQAAARRSGRPGLAVTGSRGLCALAAAGQILLSWLAALPAA